MWKTKSKCDEFEDNLKFRCPKITNSCKLKSTIFSSRNEPRTIAERWSNINFSFDKHKSEFWRWKKSETDFLTIKFNVYETPSDNTADDRVIFNKMNFTWNILETRNVKFWAIDLRVFTIAYGSFFLHDSQCKHIWNIS